MPNSVGLVIDWKEKLTFCIFWISVVSFVNLGIHLPAWIERIKTDEFLVSCGFKFYYSMEHRDEYLKVEGGRRGAAEEWEREEEPN